MSEPKSPVAAFEALLATVERLRQEVAQLSRQLGVLEVKARPVDYTPTLSDTAQRLERLEAAVKSDTAERLERLEAAVKDMKTSVAGDTKALAGEWRQAIGEVVTERHWRWVAQLTLVVGLVAGIFLCIVWARLLPQRTGAWIAAEMVGDAWQAGEYLMHYDNPDSYTRMVTLYNACPASVPTTNCAAAMAALAPGK
jgi:ElaB/YqjD/DUF883 family membrane-anchored ribosome-binding protein